MADPATMPPEDDWLRAGEYSLGVLEGDELSSAQRDMLSDREFAEKVRWWRYRLGAMSEAAGEIAPSDAVWPAIERRLTSVRAEPSADLAPIPQLTPFGGWKMVASLLVAAVAGALLTFLTIRPSEGPAPAPAPTESADPAFVPGERLIVRAQSEDGSLTLAGLVDTQTDRLSLNADGLAPGEGQAAELWVVPAGGAPQSLGLLPPGGDFTRDLTEQEDAAFVEGSSLAITYEEASNAPHAAPSTDILVIGGFSRI